MPNAHHKVGPHLRKGNIYQERYIKVNEVYYMYRLKHNPTCAGRPMPWVQLKGHWLQQASLDINTPAQVRVMDGSIIFTTKDNDLWIY